MSQNSTPQDGRPVIHDPNDASDTLAFLCGADMNPTVIEGREGFSSSRFVAIASADASVGKEAGLPAELGEGEVWGIALRIASAGTAPQAIRRAPASITLQDGSQVDAVLMTNPTTVGTPEAILKEAHYWELPAEYRSRLESAAGRG